MIETSEKEQHRTIMIFLIHKGYVKKDNQNLIVLTEKGEDRVRELVELYTMEDIALLLIFFCKYENIPYHAEHGVIK